MLCEIWDAIGRFSPSQGALTGTALGALLGFATLTGGALFNAYLTRRRDFALHRFQQSNLLQALLTEIEQVAALLGNQTKLLNLAGEEKDLFSVINPATLVVIYSTNLSSLHILPTRAIQQLVAIHSAISEHEYNIDAHGGYLVSKPEYKMKSFNFDKKTKLIVTLLNKDLEKKCNEMLVRCRPILKALQ
jgi:hypothetical protein